jgi:hypothetical protein
MPRKQKQKIEINNTESLSGLMQETYNDACHQINEAQSVINELTAAAKPNDVDDATKIAKEKGGLLKVKDAAIRTKLELAKLQSEILKKNGDVEGAIKERSHGEASLKDFSSVRRMLLNQDKNEGDTE